MEIEFLETDLPKVAKKLKGQFKPGDIVGFSGQLAAGKTTLIGELARAYGYAGRTSSPTFVLEHRYSPSKGKVKEIIHLDLYRLNAEDFNSFDWEDYRGQKDKLILVEWPERLPPGLLNFSKTVTIEILNESIAGANDKKRRLTVSDNLTN